MTPFEPEAVDVLRRAAALVMTVAGLLVVAAPAMADPAGPTHYRSTITGIDTGIGAEPEGAATVEVRILGGDAFLVVRAARGTTVEVPGYRGEPYLRITEDGTVEINERSPAYFLNDERYGGRDREVSGLADSDAPPTWVHAARGGEYAWHDHRIHFMSPSLPPSVDPDAGTVQPVWHWEIPLLIDGRDAVVAGELSWLPGPSPIVPVGLVALLFAAALAIVALRPALLTPVLAVAVAGALAVGVASTVGLPAGADGDPTLQILPVVALVLLALGVVQRRRGHTRSSLLSSAAGIPVLVWGVLMLGALTRPIVPGPVPTEVVRVVVASTLASGGAALVAMARGALTATRLDAVVDPQTVD